MNHINRCYEILGLQPGASLEQVKQAYRDLAMVWHPDRFSHNPRLQEKAQEELKKINEAYEVLKSSTFSSSTQASTSNPYQPAPKDAKAYYNQGMEKAKRGRYKEAIEDFSCAIRLQSKYIEAYKYRGIAYSKLTYNQKAIEDLRQAADLYFMQGKKSEFKELRERIKSLQLVDETRYCKLREALLAKKWEEADRESLSIVLKIANREKEGSLREEDIYKIPSEYMRIIDILWIEYSSGHFGFSVQKQIWQSVLANKNADYPTFYLFGREVGWYVNGSWVSYDRLTFNLNAPVGHLPLLTYCLDGVIQWSSWSGAFLFSRSDL